MPKSPWDDVESGVTVGDLIKQLQMHPPDNPVCIGPHGFFSYYRVKDRGGIAQIEINEAYGVDYDLLPEHPYQQWLKNNPLS